MNVTVMCKVLPSDTLETQLWSIMLGDCRKILAQMPAGSVQCVVTSPPYWSLRDYGVHPSVWGGDANCVHDWAEEIVQTEIGGGNWTQAWNCRDEVPRGTTAEFREPIASESVRATCRLCGAWAGCLGLEPTPEMYVEHVVEVFRAVRRILRDDGTLWLNMGDCYNSAGRHGHGSRVACKQRTNRASAAGIEACRPNANNLKPKDLLGIPWRVAFAMQEDGWYLRQDIVWEKPNPMPESVTDRCTKAHEYVFLLAKAEEYFYDALAVREAVTGNAHTRGDGVNPKAKVPSGWDTRSGSHRELRGRYKVKQNASFSAACKDKVLYRNPRSVWTITPKPFRGAHFATFPPELAERCIKAGTSERGCCARCGAPLRRVVKVESSGEDTSRSRPLGKYSSMPPQYSHRRMAESRIKARATDGADHDNPFAVKETAGWEVTCNCEAKFDARTLPLAGLDDGPRDPIPCTVLDPFSGAGTTVMVALRLGRSGIGIELSNEYVDMSTERIKEDIRRRASSANDIS